MSLRKECGQLVRCKLAVCKQVPEQKDIGCRMFAHPVRTELSAIAMQICVFADRMSGSE